MLKFQLSVLLLAASILWPTFSWSQCTPNQVIEAVVNGDFEAGYMTGPGTGGFSSDLTYVGNRTPGCAVSTCCFWDIGNKYAVARAETAAVIGTACTANPRQTYAGPDYINNAGGFTDHTPGQGGNGFALIGDFENFNVASRWDTDAAGLPAVWRQQVTIQANQKYYFSAWFANYNRLAGTGGYTNPILNFVVVPMIGATPQWAQRANLGTATPTGQMNWQQFSGVWTPPATPSYTSAMILIEVQAANAVYSNDIVLDDISFINGCDNLTTLPSSHTPDLGADFSLCVTGAPATLQSHVPLPGTQYFWYSGTGTTQTTLVNGTSTDNNYIINAPGTYRVCIQNASLPGGCSASSTVVVTNTMPPVSLANQNICSAATVTLTATLPSGATYSGTGLSYAWTIPSGAPASVNSPTYSTNTTGTYSVTVTPSAGALAAGCTAVTSNNATVTTSLVTPSFVSGDCSGTPKTFTLISTTGSGTTYGWYDAATGGNLKTTGQTTTPPLTYTAAEVPTTVYLENYNTITVGPTRVQASSNDFGGGAPWNATAFVASQNFTIQSIYIGASSGLGTATITLANASAPGVPLATATQVVSANNIWYQVPVNFSIVAGQSYIINMSGGSMRFMLQSGYSTTAYGGIVTRTPTPNGTSGSAIEWTVRLGSTCMRTPFTIDCALPVEFLYFDANRSGSVVNLDWVTASEVDAKSFIIERSLNGTDYTAIGEVDAKNSKNGASYEFIDSNPANANGYYRLRQVDFNGSYKYSEIRYVSYVSIGELTLVPNPAQDVLKIILSSGTGDMTNASVHLFNTLGQELYLQNVSTNQLRQGWNIDLNGFSKGAYVVKVITVEGEWIEQLIKE